MIAATDEFLRDFQAQLVALDKKSDNLCHLAARCRSLLWVVNKARDIYVAILNLGAFAANAPYLTLQTDEPDLTKPAPSTIPDGAEALLESAQQAITKLNDLKTGATWTVKGDAVRDLEAALAPLSTNSTSFHLFDSSNKKLSQCAIWWKMPGEGWRIERWTKLLATSSGYESNLGLIEKNNQNVQKWLKQIDDKAKST